VRLLNLLIVAATVVSVLGGYLQERKRLATIRTLPPARAQALFEATERRRERTMLVVTVAVVVASAVALLLRAAR
jgi:integral membrane sensor domain MASE1